MYMPIYMHTYMGIYTFIIFIKILDYSSDILVASFYGLGMKVMLNS